jgi:DNA-binding SARP family transcriptional activator
MAPMSDSPVADARPAGLQLIDGFRLWIDGSVVHTAPSVQRLLALLALRSDPVTRSAAGALLWPKATRLRAGSCLRSTLSRLVRPGCALIEVVDDALRIAPGVQVDVALTRRMGHQIDAGAELPVSVLAAELLPGWTEPWLDAERDWFRQVRLRLLEATSERHRRRGDHLGAYRAAMVAVHADPLRESAHRQVIALHLEEGNPAAAMRQFTAYRTRLRRELGLSPSPEIHKLVQPLLRG